MVDWRTLMLGFAAFSGTFAAGMWLSGGGLSTLPSFSFTDTKLPSAVAGVAAGARRARAGGVTRPHGLTAGGPADDARLRRSVVLRAGPHLKPSCSSDPQQAASHAGVQSRRRQSTGPVEVVSEASAGISGRPVRAIALRDFS